MEELTPAYWDRLYKSGRTGWDIGYVSTPLKEYFDQLTDKTIRILIPGAGNAYEAEYLHKTRFVNTFVLEYSVESIRSFIKRYPSFPESRLLEEDFFEHQGKYDLIVEQTFFSSIPRNMRHDYAKKMHELLVPGGKLVGLLFTHEFDSQHPPYGGSIEEYRALFQPYFKFKTFEIAHNSIKPRAGRELFFILQKEKGAQV